jgi:hypothetical protein
VLLAHGSPVLGNEPIPSNFSSFYPWWPRVAMQARYSRSLPPE